MKDIAQTQHIRAMLFEDLDSNSPTFGAMCIGTMGFEIASARNAEGTDWDFRTFGTGKGFIADEIVAGILSTILIQNQDGSFKIDLSGTGGAKYYNDGKIAMEMAKNQLKLYNWKKDDDYVGSLGVAISGNDPDKPLISLWNDLDSFLSLAYKDSDGNVPSYIAFDKYNIASEGKAIKVYEAIDIRKGLYFSNGNAHFESGGLETIRTNGGMYVTGDFSVQGSKNCIQATANYGDRLFYSVEDTDSYLTYRVATTVSTGLNKEIKIDIDSIYKECVNMEIDYIVEINKVSFGDYRIKEQNKDYFILESDRENFEFKYTIVAKRKGYEDRHIDEYIKKEEVI